VAAARQGQARSRAARRSLDDRGRRVLAMRQAQRQRAPDARDAPGAIRAAWQAAASGSMLATELLTFMYTAAAASATGRCRPHARE